jgi:hypothetical protein
MGYLLPTEYVQYGLTAETSDDWITMASALMEAHCRRPSLLVTQYVERMRLTSGSQSVRLSYRPLAVAAGAASALVGVRVRYGRPRRGELVDEFRQQVVWAFGLPGSWTSLDVTTVDVNETIGELTFPVNFLGLDYNEVEVTYTSGLSVVPDAVKVACVQIVKNAQATPSVNVKQTKMDTMWMQYFGSSLIDPQVQMLLKPYVAERLG